MVLMREESPMWVDRASQVESEVGRGSLVCHRHPKMTGWILHTQLARVKKNTGLWWERKLLSGVKEALPSCLSSLKAEWKGKKGLAEVCSAALFYHSISPGFH